MNSVNLILVVITFYTIIFREVVHQMRVHDLLFQKILLVEKKDY
jgi:hypothetical protein